MSGDWVDFKVVKERVTMQMVLDRYGVKLNKSGSELRGVCPFHKGSKRNFQVNLEKNVFNCFSDDCGAKGNVLDFVRLKESCSVREAAIKLASWFNIESSDEPVKEGKDKLAAKEKQGTGDLPCDEDRVSERASEKNLAAEMSAQVEPGDDDSGQEENPPLEFELKGIDPGHPYLIKKRGIRKETAEHFGVGFFPGKGTMQGRIVFPISRVSDNSLVAYAGRWPGDSGWPADEDKYKFPAGFKKSLELFNLHRVLKSSAGGVLIVCEGFFSVLKVHQGLAPHLSYAPPVVALMGRSMSDVQEQLLIKNFDYVVLMLDGDQPGREATAKILPRLARSMYVRVVEVPDGKQPDKLSSDEIRHLLSFPVSICTMNKRAEQGADEEQEIPF